MLYMIQVSVFRHEITRIADRSNRNPVFDGVIHQRQHAVVLLLHPCQTAAQDQQVEILWKAVDGIIGNGPETAHRCLGFLVQADGFDHIAGVRGI